MSNRDQDSISLQAEYRLQGLDTVRHGTTCVSFVTVEFYDGRRDGSQKWKIRIGAQSQSSTSKLPLNKFANPVEVHQNDCLGVMSVACFVNVSCANQAEMSEVHTQNRVPSLSIFCIHPEEDIVALGKNLQILAGTLYSRHQ